MVATDVVALFPSLDLEETSRICVKMAEWSDLEIEGVDYTEMLLYIRLNQEHAGDLGYLTNFLPVRRSKGGTGPTMRNTQIKGPWHQDEIERDKLQWIHKPPPRNVRIRRRILGKAIEVGVKLLFTTFAYTFGGKIYQQLDGAPIGTRIACAAANLVMEYVWDRVRALFRDSGPGFKLWLALNFFCQMLSHNP